MFAISRWALVGHSSSDRVRVEEYWMVRTRDRDDIECSDDSKVNVTRYYHMYPDEVACSPKQRATRKDSLSCPRLSLSLHPVITLKIHALVDLVESRLTLHIKTHSRTVASKITPEVQSALNGRDNLSTKVTVDDFLW